MSELGPVLAGCRILVTAQRRADELGGALTRRGASVVVAPALGVVPHVDEAALLEATRKIIADPVDVVVVTTGIGFRGWLDTAEAAGLADELVSALDDIRLVARGPKARGALQAAGLRADWVAESETSAEIADFLLAEGVAHQRIAVQRHGAGDDGLHDRLTGGGASVLELEVYRWGPPPDPLLLSATTEELADGGFDAVLFTSAPGAAAWLTELRRLDRLEDARGLAESGHAARRHRRPGDRRAASGGRLRRGGARTLADGRTGAAGDHGRSAAAPESRRPEGRCTSAPSPPRSTTASSRSRPPVWPSCTGSPARPARSSRARSCCASSPATRATRTPPRWRSVGCATPSARPG